MIRYFLKTRIIRIFKKYIFKKYIKDIINNILSYGKKKNFCNWW